MTVPRAHPPRPASLAFIFITALLDVLALGIILPVLPRILSGFVEGDTTRTAQLFGLFATSWAVMQFFFSPMLGALSDALGRRPLVLISNFGLGLDYILMALAPSLGWLFVGRVVSGITAASVSTVSAYIADVTPPEKRAASFGLLGAVYGGGIVLGPALGGLLGDRNPHLPFWIAAGLSLANALYGVFVLPESLPPERRTPFSLKNASPLGSIVLLRSRRELFGLVGVYFLASLSLNVVNSVFVLYVGYRFGWGERAVGLTLALEGVLSLIVQGVLVNPVVKVMGERRTLLGGLVLGLLGLFCYGLVSTGPWFLLCMPLLALNGLFGPAALGLMSNRVPATQQGQFQGALISFVSISGIIGPAIFSQVFAFGIDPRHDWKQPGAPFFLAALIMGLALLWAGWILRTLGEPPPQALPQPDEGSIPSHGP